MRKQFRAYLWVPWLLFPVMLAGQTNRGTLTGVVMDSSGASIAGADVTATNREAGTTFHAQSSTTGDFTIPELPFGKYDVTVAFQGFQTYEAKDVEILANQVARLNVQLQLGQQVQRVEVTSAAPIIQNDSDTVEQGFTTRQITDLPLTIGAFLARSPEAFTFLTPGVSGDTFRTRINGGPQFSNEILVDGASTTRSENGPAFDETAPSVEAFGEFTIKTNNFSAEYGATGSAITSFAYKSGTNHLHGDAYEFLRATPLDAAGFYDTGRCTISGQKVTDGRCVDPSLDPHRRPILDQKNNFGFTAGGPAYLPKLYDGRNKTFWFFSYEAVRLANQFSVNPVFVPTAKELTGDFSELLSLPSPVTIYDPQTGQPFFGNKIPQERFSPVSKYALQFFPKANTVDPATGLSDKYTNGVPLSLTVNLYTVVADHNLTDRQKVHFSLSRRNNFRSRDPDNLLAGNNPLTQLRRQDFTTRYYRAAYDYALKPDLFSHLNLGYNRTTSVNGTVTVGDNFVKNSGLTGVANTHTPEQNISGFNGGKGMTLGNTEYNDNIDNSYQIAENLTWVKGRHAFKFGVDIHRQLYDPKTQNNGAGHFDFFPGPTSGVDAQGNRIGGDAFASYLLGAVNNVFFNLNLVNPGWRRLYWASFIQDDFKATRKLTVNMGLRWDISDPRSEVFNRTSSLDPHLPNPAAGNIPGALAFAKAGRTHFDQRNWKLLGPRVGLSYGPNDKTVLHAGYGIYYAQLFYNDFGEHTKQGFDASPNFVSPDGHSPAFYWQDGVPQNFARPPFTDPAGVNLQNIDFIAPEDRVPYIQSWNLGIERELPLQIRLSASYAGNKGTRLYRGFDIEQLDPRYLALGPLLSDNIKDVAVLAAGFTAPYATFASDWGSGATLARALRLFPQYSGVTYYNNTDGYSTYNSFQLKVEKRFSEGLQFLLSYTNSKSLTDADSLFPFTAFAFTQNDHDSKLEKSVSTDDQPQVLAASYLYELPVGRGKHFLNRGGVVDKVLGGWQLNGIVQYSSGTPLQLGAGCPSIGDNFGGGCRPNVVSGQSLLGPGASGMPGPNNGKPYLNAAAFSVPAPFTYGIAARLLSGARSFGFMNENK